MINKSKKSFIKAIKNMLNINEKDIIVDIQSDNNTIKIDVDSDKVNAHFEAVYKEK